MNKSKALENLAAVIQALPDQLVEAMPMSTGGINADAVANGVRAALDGLSRTTVPHDKSATN
ncbi:hypothetical protein [Kutzneria sp. 744]|uniref:hypothetical protein n=1 Tax=Kutzneria sp. (strain 744) TaxID=345341 RepID=UPI0004AF9903|nr:hypothetical protein [Kutzneria sp. 744]